MNVTVETARNYLGRCYNARTDPRPSPYQLGLSGNTPGFLPVPDQGAEHVDIEKPVMETGGRTGKTSGGQQQKRRRRHDRQHQTHPAQANKQESQRDQDKFRHQTLPCHMTAQG